MTPGTESAEPASADVDPEQDEKEVFRLGPFAVRTDPREVEDFLRETGGLGAAGFVPLTFPFRWLALPSVRSFILQAMGGGGLLPVHESQSFVYERELRSGAGYILNGDARRTMKPPRLILRFSISSPQGELCAHLETVLRIVRVDKELAS
ncbi:MAG: hypothetical protein L0Y57_09550 [Beijerinckiaceae bacterium]|nr:hypothetical protein [Beijerinckiaceae bacterium]